MPSSPLSAMPPRRWGRSAVLAALLVSVACETKQPGAAQPVTSSEPQKAAHSKVPPPAQGDGTHRSQAAASSAAPFAVVELFTSEGCSSCPPADRNLALLAERADAGERVFPLSFHVDYWNHLGWRDPFSSKQFSERQRSYARQLSGRVYTPQIVVNGQAEMVGSRRQQVAAAIEAALARPASVGVKLELKGSQTQEYTLTYRVEPQDPGAPPRGTLNLALIQSRAERDVKAGENAGRTLSHRNVVIKLEKRAVPPVEGTWAGAIPESLSRSQARIVAYLQAEDFRVLGAASVGW